MLGVKVYEQGNFGCIELPDIFDISKLMLTYSEIKLESNNLHKNLKLLTNIFYDGKKIFIEQDGNTLTINTKFFIVEPILSKDQKNVTFNLKKEFITKSH